MIRRCACYIEIEHAIFFQTHSTCCLEKNRSHEVAEAGRGSRSIRTARLASISHRSAVVDVTVSRYTCSAARFAITISAFDRCGCAHIGFRARQQRGAKRDESTDAIARDGDEESRKEGESERSCQPPSQYGSLLHQAASFPIICHSLT